MSSGVGDDGSDAFRFEVLRGKKEKKKKQSCVLDRSAKRKKKKKKKKKKQSCVLDRSAKRKKKEKKRKEEEAELCSGPKC